MVPWFLIVRFAEKNLLEKEKVYDFMVFETKLSGKSCRFLIVRFWKINLSEKVAVFYREVSAGF